jgi:hypothetical protein
VTKCKSDDKNLHRNEPNHHVAKSAGNIEMTRIAILPNVVVRRRQTEPSLEKKARSEILMTAADVMTINGFAWITPRRRPGIPRMIYGTEHVIATTAATRGVMNDSAEA